MYALLETNEEYEVVEEGIKKGKQREVETEKTQPVRGCRCALFARRFLRGKPRRVQTRGLRHGMNRDDASVL